MGTPSMHTKPGAFRTEMWRVSLLIAGIAAAVGASWCFKQLSFFWGWSLWGVSAVGILVAAWTRKRGSGSSAWSRLEVVAVAVLILVGAVGRFYKVTELPGGIWSDETEIGTDALEILDGSDRTLLGIGRIEVPRPYAGMLALLFRVAGTTVFTLKLPGLIFSVVGLLTTYLLTRSLFGPWAAVLVLGLLSGSRWALNMSRWGHVQTWLIPSLTLVPYLTLRFLRSGRYSTACLAGAALSLSQYTYHSCRLAVPVTGALIALCLLHDRRLVRTRWQHVVLMALTAMVLFAPLGIVYLRDPQLYVARARAVSLLANLEGKPAMQAVWESLRAYLIMYNVRGDWLGRHNYGMRPMVDWVTAGLALAGVPLLVLWVKRWQVQFLWILTLLTLATGVFTTGAPSTFRTLSQLVPYLMIASLPIAAMSEMLAARQPWHSAVLGITIAGILAVVIPLNTYEYFVTQLRDPGHWLGFAPASTMVASEAAARSATHDVYYSRELELGNLGAFKLLLHGKKNHFAYKAIHLPFRHRDERPVVLFDERRTEAHAVAAAYPGSVLDHIESPFGLYLYSRLTIPSSGLGDGRGLWLDTDDGRVRVDQIDSGQLRAGTSGTWVGSLIIEQAGLHRFSVTAPGSRALEIAGRHVDGARDVAWVLPEGLIPFSLRVGPGSDSGPVTVLWQRPGAPLEPIPADAWSRLTIGNTGLVVEDYEFVSEARPPISVRRAFSWEPFNPGNRAEWRNVYSGRLRATESGAYEFRITADDSATLYIDGEPLGRSEFQSVRMWEKGTDHSLLLVYVQRGGAYSLNIAWKPPDSHQFKPIPSDVLYVDWDYLAQEPWANPESRARHLAPDSAR